MSTPTLAERIASALLTPHGGPEGTRLAIKLKRPDGTESDLGGNVKASVVRVITEHLDAPLRDARAALLAAMGHTPAGSNAATLCANAVKDIDAALSGDHAPANFPPIPLHWEVCLAYTPKNQPHFVITAGDSAYEKYSWDGTAWEFQQCVSLAELSDHRRKARTYSGAVVHPAQAPALDTRPTPQPPARLLLPKGFTHWEPRGWGWTADDGPPVTFANIGFEQGRQELGWTLYDVKTEDYPEGIGFYYEAIRRTKRTAKRPLDLNNQLKD